jgi:hypothetical protein
MPVLRAAFLLFAISFRALGASFSISEHPESAAVDEATPAAGSNGTNCLIVWKDNRSGNQPSHQGQYLLYGRRFDLSGHPLDAASFQIQDEAFMWNNEGLTLPSVAALEGDYLVSWITRFRQIEARRVLSDGTVQADRIALANTGNASGQPALASGPRGWAVAWTDRVNNNGNIYVTLLERDGQAARMVPIAADAANAQFPVIANIGNDYLVLWSELVPLSEGIIKAALVTPAGKVRRLDSFPPLSADWIALASNGRNCFLARQTGSFGSEARLSGYVLNSRGQITREETLLAAGGEQLLFGVLPSEFDFTVVWRQNPYVTDALLYTIPVSTRGVVRSEPLSNISDMGWSGYGAVTRLGQSTALVVLEQKTPDYDNNGLLSRVHGTVIAGSP